VIQGRIEDVAQSGKNLLYLAVPSSGDLAVIYDETLDKPTFYQAFYDLVYGPDSSPDRVEHFSTYLESHSLPNKWTFATYFLYLLSPETEMYVKPTTKSWFLKFCGAQKSLLSRPNHDDYKLILDLCNQLKEDLSKYNPTNLIDIQGFIWVAKQVESQRIISSKRIEEFQSLYEEFLNDFLYTEKGDEHIRYILEGRNQAKNNFDAINQAHHNGEDITDMVLLKLIPYTDSQKNKEKGAWIHVAPAIQGNIKSWFENVGWTKPDDWPKIAKAILDFVNKCITNPENLEEACEEFVELPFTTGLQTGMMTPILNALRPDDFILVNNKPREVINYFAETEYKQTLLDYPDINDTAKEMINTLSSIFNQTRNIELRHIDLFDIFSHWLVAEKCYFKPKVLGENFKELFGNVDDALLVFEFLEVAAETLQIKSPDDPLIALSFFKPGKDIKLHLSYGNWLVIGFHGSGERLNEVEINLIKDSIDLPFTWEANFSILQCEPQFSLYGLGFEDFKANRENIMPIFIETLEHISRRFNHWKASPYHNVNNPTLAEAILDESIKDELLVIGLSFGSNPPKPIDETHYWKIAPGESAWNWETWVNENVITIGWEELGDLSGKTKEEIYTLYADLMDEYPDWGPGGKLQLARFMDIQIGDRIIANKGKGEILGYGTVVGEYYYVPNTRHGHRIPVEWDNLEPRIIDEGGWAMTILELDEEKFNNLIQAPIKLGEQPNPEYTLEDCSAETFVNIESLDRWVRAIDRKKQAIFYGPPGTGKTFIAERLAKHLIAGGYGFSELVQFHPEVSYEDFIQGIRPQENENGDLRYPLAPGRFLQFCESASKTEDICVFIIDEINRANLSRVFGELMYLLEYRDKSIKLAAGKTFMIPSNVRIIGTMNTADRSIALVDHALRRRFAFLSLYPDYDILRKFHRKVRGGFNPEKLISKLESLNKQIGDRHYSIGPSYFLREDIQECLEDIWRMEIEPYLEEFFFDQPDNFKKFTWEVINTEI